MLTGFTERPFLFGLLRKLCPAPSAQLHSSTCAAHLFQCWTMLPCVRPVPLGWAWPGRGRSPDRHDWSHLGRSHGDLFRVRRMELCDHYATIFPKIQPSCCRRRGMCETSRGHSLALHLSMVCSGHPLNDAEFGRF